MVAKQQRLDEGLPVGGSMTIQLTRRKLDRSARTKAMLEEYDERNARQELLVKELGESKERSSE